MAWEAALDHQWLPRRMRESAAVITSVPKSSALVRDLLFAHTAPHSDAAMSYNERRQQCSNIIKLIPYMDSPLRPSQKEGGNISIRSRRRVSPRVWNCSEIP